MVCKILKANKKPHKRKKRGGNIIFSENDDNEYIEWWKSLTDQERWDAYNFLRKSFKNKSDTLDLIVDHLLGKNWYSVYYDAESINTDILETIKRKYRDVNKKSVLSFLSHS